MSLEEYGWNESWEEKLNDLAPKRGIPGRVISEHRNEIGVHTDTGDISARTAGKLFHKSTRRTDRPAVGDWVIVDDVDTGGNTIIHHVLPRNSTFSRRASGKSEKEQIIAANLDTVWIVTTFDADLSPARLERYVTLVLENQAQPVIVIAKSDLIDDMEPIIETLRIRLPDVSIHGVSVVNASGLQELRPYLTHGQTIALLGSSGVGKSTLINHFAGREVLHTASVREKDGKGRHTTTHRELILLPDGGVLLDTPGMRELQLWGTDDTLDKSFADIEVFAAQCRFSDCSHESEPGCAVREAAINGELDENRLENFKKLRGELKYLERRTNVRADLLERERWKSRSKEQKRYSKFTRDQGKR